MTITVIKSGIFYNAKVASFAFSDMLSLSNELVASKLAISSDDSELIYSFIEQGVASVLDFLPQTTESTNTQDGFTLTIPTGLNYNPVQTSGIEVGIKTYIMNYVLNEWYKLKYPERCQFHIMAMEQDRSNINSRLNKRTIPVRREQSPW